MRDKDEREWEREREKGRRGDLEAMDESETTINKLHFKVLHVNKEHKQETLFINVTAAN